MAIAPHQRVGSLTRDITPKVSMHFNSACTFGLKAIGMFLGVPNANYG